MTPEGSITADLVVCWYFDGEQEWDEITVVVTDYTDGLSRDQIVELAQDQHPYLSIQPMKHIFCTGFKRSA